MWVNTKTAQVSDAVVKYVDMERAELGFDVVVEACAEEAVEEVCTDVCEIVLEAVVVEGIGTLAVVVFDDDVCGGGGPGSPTKISPSRYALGLLWFTIRARDLVIHPLDLIRGYALTKA
jgi:hypothetical protein